MHDEHVLNTRLSEHPELSILRLQGEFDIFHRQQLDQAFDEALSQESKRVIVDLSATSYFDSTCLGTLVGAKKRSEEVHKQFDLVVAKGSFLAKIFKIAGIDRLFQVYESIDQAVDNQ